MGIFTWFDGEVPENLKIKQVYGLVFTEDGRILLRVVNSPKGKTYSLAGGKPEKTDNGIEGTLRRETLEEVNTKLKDKACLVGYLLVNEGNGIPPYAQVRMTAIIDEVGEKLPDTDGGEIYDRLLTTPEKAIKLLNWGKEGEQMVKAAVKVAKQQLGMKTLSQTDEYV